MNCRAYISSQPVYRPFSLKHISFVWSICTAPNGKYGWLNNTVFVSAVRFSPQKPGVVIIDVYEVL
ncbi:MAG: DUF3237 family protein [Pseudohongiellaceae bacterium]